MKKTSVIFFRTFFFSLVAVLGLTALSPNATHAQLISLNSGMQMTCQFVNNTNGQYSNSQIYVIAIGLNSSNQYCYLQPNGTMTPLVAGQNASGFFTPLSAMNGMQMPTVMTSCRMYVSLGTPLNIPINSGTPVGIAYPNISNPSDPNINTIFDWIEFNVGNNLIFCNTTQVDMFGIPMLMQLFDNTTGGAYSLFGTVGLTEPTSQLMTEYAASVPAAFAGLAGPDRILAPIHGSFGTGGANAGYFDSYINSVWSEYTNTNLVIPMPSATYTGRVNGSGQLAFTTPGDPNTYLINKPTTNDVWGGAGALATGNSVELALEAQICAAFHRHVIDNAANLSNPSAFYQAAPMDYFSQFWHLHNVGGAAYGFCYDDVDNQSSSLVGTNPRGIILTIGGGAGGTPTPTPTPVTHSTWRVVAGGPAHTDCQSNVWAADENYIGGTAATTTNTITGALPCASDTALYQDQRYGSPFTYGFNVPAGSYQITLKFAETYWTAPGQRIFNVSINGTQVLTNFDVFATAGGQNKAIDEVFNNIAPLGGAITIQFGPASTDNAMVSSIQIIPQPVTPTFTPTSTKSFTPTFSFTPSFTGTSTFTRTDTSTPTNTFSSTKTYTPTGTPTFTYTSTKSMTSTPTNTWTSSSTATSSFTPTGTSTSTSTATHVFTATATNTLVNTSTSSFTPTSTPIITNTAVNTSSPTGTSTATLVNTATKTPVNSPTGTSTSSPTAILTSTSTLTNTATKTLSPTSTWTNTFSSTPTNTWTHSPTGTSTSSPTATSTWTYTLTNTPSFTSTSTATSVPHTATPSFTPTYTFTSVPLTSTPTAASACSGIPAWNGNFVVYATGQKVSYNGDIYQCIQSHTSEPNWMPSVVPALWKDLGPCGSTPTAVPALIAQNPVVYPNPATTSSTTIQLPVTNATNVKVQIYTVAFRAVKTMSLPQVMGDSVTVELVDKAGMTLANGLYYFEIEINGQRWMNKVLVLR